MSTIANKVKNAGGLVISLFFLSVLVGCAADNHSPVIADLAADTNWVLRQGSAEVKCVAFDPDGDALAYAWSASGGTIAPSGATAKWTAPQAEGTYTIMVKVTDARRAEVTRKLVMNVGPNRPPRIESLTAAPSIIGQAETTVISCVATDPDGDGLSYQWSAERGNISGQGPRITWTSPNVCDDYPVKVTVTDSQGAITIRQVMVTVKKPG